MAEDWDAPSSTAKQQLAFASLVFFLVEFGAFYTGYSLETVFITPFFIRLETPWLVDSFIWLVPSLLLLVLNPTIRQLRAKGVMGRHLSVSAQMAFTLVGLGVLTSASMVGEFYHGEDTTMTLVMAFLGFLVMDIGLTTLDCATAEMLEEAEWSRDEMLQWSSGWKHFGKVGAYFLASCDALQLGSRYIYYVMFTQNIGDSMTMAFSVAAALFLAVLLFILPSVRLPPAKPESEEIVSYSTCLSTFMHSPAKLKLLFLAHFFSYGSYLLITVYATSWVGISVLDGTPTAEKFTLRRRVFEMGVSWGAFAMLLCSLVSMLCSLLQPTLRRKFSDSVLWGLSQSLAALALLTTFQLKDFKGIFVVLPLCGFAVSTASVLANEVLHKLIHTHVVSCPLIDKPHRGDACPSLPFHRRSVLPPLLRFLRNTPDEHDRLHLPMRKTDPWGELMACTSLLGQVVMFSVVPSIFLLWPEGDDNKWGMVTAGISSLLGSVCAFLL